MADNVTANSGSGGATFRTDDDGTAHWPYTKLAWGADNTQTVVTTGASAIPVQDGGNSLTVDNAGITTIAGAVSGTEMQVDVVAALPAGTNAIGKLAANSGVDIGDVDVTSIVPGTGATNLGKAEDAAHSSGDTGVAVLAVRRDTAAVGSDTDGDYSTLNVNASGRLYTSATVDAALPAGTNAIGKLAANSGVDIGDVDVTSVPAPLSTTGGGTEATALRVTIASDSTGVVSVDDNGGALTVDGTVTASNATGNVAHDDADSGNPVKIGAKARTTVEGVTLVAENDRTDLYADLDGVLIVKPNIANGDIINERVSNTDGNSTAFTNFGAVASTRNYIKTVVVHNAHATTNGYVDIRDGTAGTILATIPAPATGGAVVNFDPPLRSTANTAMAFDVSAAITTVYITATGWQSKA